MSTITIRPLLTKDIALCAQMMSQSDPWLTFGRDYKASYQTISDPIKEVYLAVTEETIAGFIIINMTGAFIGYIQSVCVDTAWRGRGIGTQLINYAEERIFRSTPNVFICVSSFNKGARKLYERLGYSIVGELQDYVIPGASEILLRKTIAPLAVFSPSISK
ncbi:GNAT family N-acetyltransferase [Pseudanabaena sp. FACHB-2040]|uniref:GNAT family N-acetyltransferase n=1 Tax=Pseudanabaena sp. FACHB-2040 TaxID=2692859 RepID=UPI00168898CC|nr:GNAT family N-acetyltransferase [Pseudanabaena sp. FACHB-2040]MBD2257429.1 GNAT family N-acetyltransferase [Pseudanabaena sp. FACHB-2040]